MDVAQHVITKFGGQAALARLIGKGPSTVQHWAKVGIIPSKWHDRLLAIARERGIDLSPGDLVELPRPLVLTSTHLQRLPEAKWPGVLPLGDSELPVYVLDDGRRVISRTGATSVLIGRQGGGNLESYLGIQVIKGYLPPDLWDHMIEFAMPGVVNKTVLGMDAETFLDICRAYAEARDDGVLATRKQLEIAIRAGMFLSACAKVGFIALIDEVTGYQYDRAEDALQVKLKLYLEDEMRKWEKHSPMRCGVNLAV